MCALHSEQSTTAKFKINTTIQKEPEKYLAATDGTCHRALQMAVAFELARAIHSTVPQFCIPCSIPHLQPVQGQGGGQRKTQKPEVYLEFIPLNISHS